MHLIQKDWVIIPLMFFLFIVQALIELLGIGIIIPYVAFIANPDDVTNPQFDVFLGVIKDWFSSESLLIILSVMLVIVFTIKWVFGIFVSYYIAKFSMKQQVKLRMNIMRSHQLMPYKQYLTKNSSTFIYNMQTLVPTFTDNVLYHGIKAVSDVVIVIAIVGLLLFVNGVIFLGIVAVFGVFVFLYDKVLKTRIMHYGKSMNQYSSDFLRTINESNSGLKEIRVLGAEHYFFKHALFATQKYGEANIKSRVVGVIPRFSLELILVIVLALLIVFSPEESKNLSTVVLFAVAGIRLIPAINTIMSAMVNIRVTRDSVFRLSRVIFESTKIDDNKLEKTKAQKFHSITMKNVYFEYHNADNTTLSDISLEIRAGESIGIIGQSGSGKTTMVDVILGLLTPNQGEMLFNDKQYDNDLCIDSALYLPQQVFIVDSSLVANITLGADNIDFEKLNNAIKQARLSDLVDTLPDGVDTILGEGGMRLSGGQRQKIAIARAFYHDRELLIMDEATSALDQVSEADIIDEIKTLKRKKTVLLIAHRLTTVQHCDRIYKMEKGRIIAVGTPKEILNL